MKQYFETCAATPDASRALIDMSLSLATGEFWLGQTASGQITVEKVADPPSEWAQRVDAIEAPFAQDYDSEEYTNQALDVLNLQELGMLADAFGVLPPWMKRAEGSELQGRRMLDIGCGTGRILLFGAALGAGVTAIDQTANYVEVAADKARRLPAGVPQPKMLVEPAEVAVGQIRGADIATAMFGVLNHCEDWQGVISGVRGVLKDKGVFALSMYGSLDAVVYDELANGTLAYAPSILTRRVPGGILLGEDAGDILPAKFPYPDEVVDQIERSGFEVTKLQPFLAVTALYPKNPSKDNIARYLRVVERRFGGDVSQYLAEYAGDASQLLVASLCADYLVPVERVNDAAYFGVTAVAKT